MRDAVASYRAAGWATIRCEPVSKRPVGAWQDRTDEPAAFLDGENVGVRLGDPSGGLVDVDADCPEAVVLAPRYLPPTLTFGRVGPGKTAGVAVAWDTVNVTRRHWLFQCFGAKTRKPVQTHVELRSTGSQTVFPPSIHDSGVPLVWCDSAPVAALDEQTMLGAFGRLAAATAIARAWPRAEGNRHHLMLSLAGALWHAGWALDDALDLLLPATDLTPGDNTEHREQAIRDTFDEHERERWGWPTVARILGDRDAKAIERALELVPTMPRALAPDADPSVAPMTDLGNAEAFTADHGQDLRSVVGLGWIQWDGTRWEPLESRAEPYHLAGQTARRLQRQGVDLGNAALAKWGVQTENISRMNAMIRIARDLPQVKLDVAQLDAQPLMLCCPNGIVDLTTGQLHPHTREAMQTKVAGVPYDPAAQAPRFASFMREIMCGDVDLAAYVLRFLGYGLTSLTTEQIFQVWHGAGANGKSTLIDTVRYVLGDYGQILASDLLMERRNGRDSSAPSPDVARMRGVRFAAGVETKEGQRWNESLVKQLTGSDRIVARHLHKEPIEFLPTWKIALAVNHKPIVRGTDHGMWRRIHLVPFDARFDGSKADRTLVYQLQAEGPGILAMLVNACRAWMHEGLAPPPRVLAEVDAYREGQDVIGSFLEECCEVDGTQSVSVANLYRAYATWSRESGEFCHGKHTFNNRIRDRGFVEARSNGRVWRGLALRGVMI